MNISPYSEKVNTVPTFSGIIFHNKRAFAKIGNPFVESMLESSVVKSFAKRKDYDLHIKSEDSNGVLLWKIKSIKQGIRGFFNNLLAPWKKSKIEDIKQNKVDEYIDFYHPTHEEIKLMLRNDAKHSAEIRANLKQQREKEDLLIKKMKDVENY